MSQPNSKLASIAYKAGGCFLGLLIFVGIFYAYLFMVFRPDKNGSTTKLPRLYIRSMNERQNAYFAKQSAFATSLNALGSSLTTETSNHKYSVVATKEAAFHYGVSKGKEFKSCVGGVFVVAVKELDTYTAVDKVTTISIMCEADSPGIIKPAEPTYQNGKIACAKGTTEFRSKLFLVNPR